MELIAIKKQLHKKIKQIYMESFPRVERKPYWLMRRWSDRGRLEMLALMDGGEACGLVFACVYKDMCFIDYLAVDKNCRGGGAGSKMLLLIKERYRGKRIFLEIEVVEMVIDGKPVGNYEERERRRRFYNRNGFFEEGVRVEMFGTLYELVTNETYVSYEEYVELLSWFVGDRYLKYLKVKKISS